MKNITTSYTTQHTGPALQNKSLSIVIERSFSVDLSDSPFKSAQTRVLYTFPGGLYTFPGERDNRPDDRDKNTSDRDVYPADDFALTGHRDKHPGERDAFLGVFWAYRGTKKR
ncbi:MAG: hypothetical protein JEZ14_12670 [Marinilabiliaceae bacterium]|nr:hypothetical protein [Marinilabiliaceae bacterium]